MLTKAEYIWSKIQYSITIKDYYILNIYIYIYIPKKFKKVYLFKIEVFGNFKNVFIITFDQFNALSHMHCITFILGLSV